MIKQRSLRYTPVINQSSLKAQLFATAVLGSLAIVVVACAAQAVLSPVYWTERLPISNASGQALAITDYRYASSISYEELAAFLANDSTYLADYDYPNVTCGDFAVKLHDRAEAYGIDCGIVGVTFNKSDNINGSDISLNSDTGNGNITGHGFNVFNTTDRGRVYVDVTGITRGAKENGYQPHVMAVYLEQGMPLGEIALEQAGSFDYAYYEEQESRYGAYRQSVGEFLSEARAFDRKVNTLNDTNERYKADRAAFDTDYDNFSSDLNALKRSTDVDFESYVRLEVLRVSLLDKLNALDARSDAILAQSYALDAEKVSLIEKRASLEQDAAGSMIITQWGIVDRIAVCW